MSAFKDIEQQPFFGLLPFKLLAKCFTKINATQDYTNYVTIKINA